MKANELRGIAQGSIDEELVGRIVEQAFNLAVRVASEGGFSCPLNLYMHPTDPTDRSTAAEREEAIRRIEEEGFTVERKDWDRHVKMHWR